MTAKDMPLPVGLNYVLVNGPEGPVSKTASQRYFSTANLHAFAEEYAAARCEELEAVLREALEVLEDDAVLIDSECGLDRTLEELEEQSDLPPIVLKLRAILNSRITNEGKP